jgi:hypothetical protein
MKYELEEFEEEVLTDYIENPTYLMNSLKFFINPVNV